MGTKPNVPSPPLLPLNTGQELVHPRIVVHGEGRVLAHHGNAHVLVRQVHLKRGSCRIKFNSEPGESVCVDPTAVVSELNELHRHMILR